MGFCSLTEAITTPAGVVMLLLLLGIMATLAAFERDLIRERTRAGLDAARRKTVLTPAKERQARRMLAEGATKDEVAGELGVSVSTLYHRLNAGTSQ